MARTLRLFLAMAITATGFWGGGLIFPVQKAEAGSCIYRNGHKYCPSDYWKGDCFYYYDDLYCRYYAPKKKKYYNGGGGSGY